MLIAIVFFFFLFFFDEFFSICSHFSIQIFFFFLHFFSLISEAEENSEAYKLCFIAIYYIFVICLFTSLSIICISEDISLAKNQFGPSECFIEQLKKKEEELKLIFWVHIESVLPSIECTWNGLNISKSLFKNIFVFLFLFLSRSFNKSSTKVKSFTISLFYNIDLCLIYLTYLILKVPVQCKINAKGAHPHFMVKE